MTGTPSRHPHRRSTSRPPPHPPLFASRTSPAVRCLRFELPARTSRILDRDLLTLTCTRRAVGWSWMSAVRYPTRSLRRCHNMLPASVSDIA
eukprot:730835-Rhodomonas_salina.1